MPKQESYFSYPSPYGRISIGVCRDSVYRISFLREKLEGEFQPASESNRCATQLLEYFAGERTVFDIDFMLCGSAFQKEVWTAVCSIPYGQTMTPKEIAAIIGRESSYRLIGAAIKECPLIPVIPAHRVISSGAKTDGVSRLCEAFRRLESKFSSPGQ